MFITTRKKYFVDSTLIGWKYFLWINFTLQKELILKEKWNSNSNNSSIEQQCFTKWIHCVTRHIDSCQSISLNLLTHQSQYAAIHWQLVACKLNYCVLWSQSDYEKKNGNNFSVSQYMYDEDEQTDKKTWKI